MTPAARSRQSGTRQAASPLGKGLGLAGTRAWRHLIVVARARPYGNCSRPGTARAVTSGSPLPPHCGASRARCRCGLAFHSRDACAPLKWHPTRSQAPRLFRPSENLEPGTECTVIGAETKRRSCAHSGFYFIVDLVAAREPHDRLRRGPKGRNVRCAGEAKRSLPGYFSRLNI